MDLMSLTASINLDTNDFENSLTGAGAAFDSFSNKVGGALGAGGVLAALGLNLNTIVSGLKEFAVDTIKTGMAFDKQMSAVQAVLGEVEGTEENMLKLRKFGLSVAQESIFTSEETAQAYYYMGMAGWKTEQMLAGLPGIINLAAASGEDLAMVSDIVTDSLTAFHMSANDASRYADVLAQTATNANTDVKRMGETFKYIAPIAGSLGYSVEEVALSIGLLANSGIKGSMAGTTLRNVFTRIATNAGATTKDLGALQIVTDMLGVQFYDAQNKVRPWLDVLTEMRTAWKGLDEAGKESLYTAFGSETLDNFKEVAAEAKKIQTTLDGTAKSEKEIREGYTNQLTELYKSNKAIFEALGIYKAKMPNIGYAFSTAMRMLGEMSDMDKIYFAKQIGSQRGMPGFLAMVEAGEEDFVKLKDSIYDAEGAAQTMAEIRLDNLAGDITMFNSALDIMKVRIFEQVKGPLRTLVQFATGSILEISDAIEEGGLEAGIEKLGEKIRAFGQKFGPAFEALGHSLAPVVSAIIEDVIAPLGETGMDIGQKLGAGIMGGILDAIARSDNPFLQQLAKWIGLENFDVTGWLSWLYPKGVEMPDNLSGKVLDLAGSQIPVEIIPELTMEDIDSAIQKANGGPIKLELSDGSQIELSSEAAQNLKRIVAEGLSLEDLLSETTPGIVSKLGGVIKEGMFQSFDDLWKQTIDSADEFKKKNASQTLAEFATDYYGTGGRQTKKKKGTSENADLPVGELGGGAVNVTGTAVTFDEVSVKPGAVANAINEAIAAAGQSGEASIQLNGQDITIADAYTIRDKLVEGADGAGAEIASAISSTIGSVDTSGLSASIGAAGAPAASTIVSAIGSKLRGASFSINVKANVTGLPSGSTTPQRNAGAMNVGRIFNRPTAFAYANGRTQIAGDAGPEAVIGTNSLSRLIRDSVQSAMNSAAASQPKQAAQPNYQIVLDSGVLVGELTPNINNELAFISSWRGGGRT